MRSDRVLTAIGAIVAVAAGVLLLALLASGGRGGADDALALSPTPVPFDTVWTVIVRQTVVGQPVVVGRPVKVLAIAALINRGMSTGANASEPTFHLDIEGDALELTSPADVSVDDVSDGASWELNAIHEGEPQLIVRLDYTLSYNITGTPPGSYHVTTETTETVEVSPPLPNGDANKDGETNSIDAMIVLQYAARLLVDKPPNADVDLDGEVDSIDAVAILQYEAGFLHELPAT